MLSRIVKHRLFSALFALLVLLAMLFAPLKHEYSQEGCSNTGQLRAANCAANPGLNTDVKYGVPYDWLTLSKAVDGQGKTIDSSSDKDIDKLIFNIAIWGLIVMVWTLATGITKLGRPSNPAK